MKPTRHIQMENRTASSRAHDLSSALKERYTPIMLLGPPGCGKGTQGRRISEFLKVPIISSGDILRENIRQRTSLGLEAKRAVDSGELVPDDIILPMLSCRVSETGCQRGFVLDGVPRTARQAKFLDTQFFRPDGDELLS